jgi:hypothetical protein
METRKADHSPFVFCSSFFSMQHFDNVTAVVKRHASRSPCCLYSSREGEKTKALSTECYKIHLLTLKGELWEGSRGRFQHRWEDNNKLITWCRVLSEKLTVYRVVKTYLVSLVSWNSDVRTMFTRAYPGSNNSFKTFLTETEWGLASCGLT